ncbi:MAG: hypothetical protein IMZ69_04720 [Spirochaetes bacterium]|nr:hypothetical protein [Spirochaetota bacterium]
MGFQYSDNVSEFMKELNRAGIAIQEAGARAINLGANFIQNKYRANIKDRFLVRASKFTLGAVRVMQAHARRSNGELRKLSAINAVVGVMNMSGGRMHYLAKQERGGTVQGGSKTGGKVPIPLVAARQGGMLSKPVAARYRIDKAEIIQMKALEGIKNPRRMYGAMRSRAERGQIDPKKLYMNLFGIFRVAEKKITMLRNTEEANVTIKAQPAFLESVRALTSARMEMLFVMSAKKLIKGGK